MRSQNGMLGVLLIPAAVVLVTLALHAISPWRQGGPVISLLVGPERVTAAAFDSRALSCPEQTVSGRGDALRLRAACALEIRGEPLELRVEHRGVTGSCEATYRGRRLPCESAIAFYNSHLPTVFVRDDLGMDADALRGLPGTNPIFYLSEGFWSRVQVALAALIALAATVLLVRNAQPAPRSAVLAVARGAGFVGYAVVVGGVVWYALLWTLLSSGLVD